MLKKIKNVIKKLKKKKGFTLIELLAVIVILSILILLAMPSVLRIMENARKNAFETEVRAYLKAAQTKYAEKAVGTNGSQSITFDRSNPLDVENKEGYDYSIEVFIDSDGNPKYKYNIWNDSYKASGPKNANNCENVFGTYGVGFAKSTPSVSFSSDICIEERK